MRKTMLLLKVKAPKVARNQKQDIHLQNFPRVIVPQLSLTRILARALTSTFFIYKLQPTLVLCHALYHSRHFEKKTPKTRTGDFSGDLSDLRSSQVRPIQPDLHLVSYFPSPILFISFLFRVSKLFLILMIDGAGYVLIGD